MGSRIFRFFGLRTSILLAFLLGSSGLTWASGYAFEHLGQMQGGLHSSASAVDPAGVAYGWAMRPNGNARPASWVRMNPRDLGTLGGPRGQVMAVNDFGLMVGASNPHQLKRTYWPTQWKDGIASGLFRGEASVDGLDNFGTVVGNCLAANPWRYSAYRWTGGELVLLPSLGGSSSGAQGINDNGWIVGGSTLTGDNASHAVLWRDGVIFDLGTLGGTNSSAYAINIEGMIVGNSQMAGDGANHAVYWQGEAIFDLGTLGGLVSGAKAINSLGLIVGYSTTADDDSWHATVWKGGVPADLNEYLPQSLRDAGWQLQAANAVNSSGVIVGSSINKISGESRAFRLRPI